MACDTSEDGEKEAQIAEKCGELKWKRVIYEPMADNAGE